MPAVYDENKKKITFCKIFPRISLINHDLLFVAKFLFYSKKVSHLGKACKQQLFLIADVSLYELQYFFLSGTKTSNWEAKFPEYFLLENLKLKIC